MAGPDTSWFEPAVRAILCDETVMTLATIGAHGPWAADVFFAARDWQLFFLSAPRSRHAGDLSATPQCAVTVHPPTPPTWREITGIQMAGRARRAHMGPEYACALTCYLHKFPFAKELISTPGDSLSAARAVPYVFEADWVRLIDNARGFGNPFAADVTADGRLGVPRPEKKQTRD